MASTPRDLSRRMAGRRDQRRAEDGFVRQSFTLPRAEARVTAREFLDRWPSAAYMSEVESWRELPGDRIEFTMRRLKSAD